jgi:hypothetical protein
MLRSVVVVALLLASSVASAQSFSPPGLTAPSVQLSPAPAPTAERKDPSTAVLLSLGITAASYVTLFAAADSHENLALLGFVGTYLGPSTGQWYAGQVGGLGLGLRAAGFVSMVYGFSQVLESECDYEYDDCSGSDGDAGGVLMLAGAGLWVGSSIYDIVLAKRAADSWNARHNVGLAPMVTADASGNRTPGLVLTGRF